MGHEKLIPSIAVQIAGEDLPPGTRRCKFMSDLGCATGDDWVEDLRDTVLERHDFVSAVAVEVAHGKLLPAACRRLPTDWQDTRRRIGVPHKDAPVGGEEDDLLVENDRTSPAEH